MDRVSTFPSPLGVLISYSKELAQMYFEKWIKFPSPLGVLISYSVIIVTEDGDFYKASFRLLSEFLFLIQNIA